MRKLLISRIHTRNLESGFSLIEVLVAMFVALIVMGMSVAILGSTNSTSLRLLAKSEAQQNTRSSLSKVFANLADADSLEVCRVASDKDSQLALTQPGATPGHPLTAFDVNKCTETSSTGYVIAKANPNKLCYFKSEKHAVGGAPSKKPPSVVCISRGRDAAEEQYDTSIPNWVSADSYSHEIKIEPCRLDGTKNDANLVYKYECKVSGGSTATSVEWPASVEAPDPDSISIIADLGSSVGAVPKKDLFSYLKEDTGPDLNQEKYVGVEVKMVVTFKNGKGTDTSEYLFNQTVVLRKSRSSLGENFNG